METLRQSMQIRFQTVVSAEHNLNFVEHFSESNIILKSQKIPGK